MSIELITHREARIGYDLTTYSHCEYMIGNDCKLPVYTKLILSTVCADHLHLVEVKPIFKNDKLVKFRFILPLCKL